MSQNKNLLLIRHAESLFNQATWKYVEEKNLPYNWKALCQMPDFRKSVNYNMKYVDPPITQKGHKQCQDTKQKLNDIHVDAVIVSPHLRALQTASKVFQGRKIPFIVDPLVSQVFRYSCDVSQPTQKKKQLFPHCDFSKVEQWGDFWYIKVLPQQQIQICQKQIEKRNCQSLEEKQKTILDLFDQDKIYEHNHILRQRAYKMKLAWENYLNKYNKIAIVAHNSSILYPITRQFNEQSQPKQLIELKNCHPHWESLEELLKYK